MSRSLISRLLAAIVLLSGCASLTQHRTGLTPAGLLQPCPAAPRCVSSLATDADRRVAPLILRDDADATWQAVIDRIRDRPRTEVLSASPQYLRAEVSSPWGWYTDDLELLRGPQRRVDIRSSARIGYYDFQVNRKRVAALRASLGAAGLIREEPGTAP